MREVILLAVIVTIAYILLAKGIKFLKVFIPVLGILLLLYFVTNGGIMSSIGNMIPSINPFDIVVNLIRR